MALTSNVSVSLTATQTTALDLGTATFAPALNAALALASGTGADQADKIWTDTRTLTASATEDLDLAGTLTDAFGATVTFVKVKAIVVSAAAANTNDVVVGGASATQLGIFSDASDKVPVKPGGFFVLAAPGAAGLCTVGAGSTDLLKVANSAGSTGVTYSIAVIGTSA